jgi:hypothetical protein
MKTPASARAKAPARKPVQFRSPKRSQVDPASNIYQCKLVFDLDRVGAVLSTGEQYSVYEIALKSGDSVE